MIDLDKLAQQSSDIRNAAIWADALAGNLRKLNSGPVFYYERKKALEEVEIAFSAISKLLSKEAA
ncbi:hypothetical protein [Rhizobium leguminosarum]|uniref:hypothetical protein n=1 Tax=Rhizobium leguminosarum TaxID=384 RepID=UPI0015DA6536|nr:hypothetical protein [Rhizobium leguminosarum]NZD50572.1 hypothetical protein [Rhizobium leguminosarum]